MHSGPFFDVFDFLEADRVELLSAESGLDGHDQHQVHLVEERVQGGDRGVGVDGDPGLHSAVVDFRYGLRSTPMCLFMNRDPVRSGTYEVIDVPGGVLDHKVHVEGESGTVADAPDHRRAEGQVGDEHPVHHIEVYPVRSGFFDPCNLIAHSGEVA